MYCLIVSFGIVSKLDVSNLPLNLIGEFAQRFGKIFDFLNVRVVEFHPNLYFDVELSLRKVGFINKSGSNDLI